MDNIFEAQLTTDEEKERYAYLKELSQKHWPGIKDDPIMAQLSEYLYLEYAKTGKLPDPPTEDE